MSEFRLTPCVLSMLLSVQSFIAADEVPPAQRLDDMIYVWGIPEGINTYEIGNELISTTDPATFAQADAPSKAAILGVENIVMAGAGLPDKLDVARKLTQQIAHLKRVIWEIGPDDKQANPADFTRRIKRLGAVQGDGPPVVAVLLDDPMRFEPNQVANLHDQLGTFAPGVQLWAVMYELHLNDKKQDQILETVVGLMLWTWNPEKLAELDQYLERMEKLAPDKPITLGLYMYDYQNNRKMPRELMELQCKKALEFARAGRVRGLVFLAVNNDGDTIEWTRDWIRQHADEKIPAE